MIVVKIILAETPDVGGSSPQSPHTPGQSQSNKSPS